jgi:hypothetical protein
VSAFRTQEAGLQYVREWWKERYGEKDDMGRVTGQAAFLHFDLEMPDPRPQLMPVKPVGGQVGPSLAGNGPGRPLRHAGPEDAKPYVRRRG